MDRVELYLSLQEDTPVLGSPQDITLRAYLVQDRNRRVAKARLDAGASITEANLKQVNKLLKDYVNAEFRLKDYYENDVDLKLREDFEEMKKLDVKLSMNGDGMLQVSGLS